MRIIFMGTPDFAAVALKALFDAGHEIAAVVTQPDKPKGRHGIMTPPPVKVLAEELSLPVFQPDTLKNGAISEFLSEYSPEAIIVAAYGKILPPYIIDFPPEGCINIHASLLPKYRGAAPIQRAIMDGEKITGVTVMKMDNGLDTGDMLEKAVVAINPTDDFETVHDALAAAGGSLITDVLGRLDSIVPQKQDESLSTYAAKIETADCLIDFSKEAAVIDCHIRALSPAPLAHTFLHGKMLKTVSARVADNVSDDLPGTVVSLGKTSFEVACGNKTVIEIISVKPEGKGIIKAGDFINGRGIFKGDVFSDKRM